MSGRAAPPHPGIYRVPPRDPCKGTPLGLSFPDYAIIGGIVQYHKFSPTANDPERKIGMDCTHSTSNYITPPSDPFMYLLIFLTSLLI